MADAPRAPSSPSRLSSWAFWLLRAATSRRAIRTFSRGLTAPFQGLAAKARSPKSLRRDLSRRITYQSWILFRAFAILSIYAVLLWRSNRKRSIRERVLKFIGADKSSGFGLQSFLFSHIVLWHYLRGKAARAGLFVRDVGSTAVSVPSQAAAYVERQTEALQNEVVVRVEKRLVRVLDSAIEKAKSKLKDEYMPEQLKRIIDDAVEEIAPDVKLAVFERADRFLWTNRPFRFRSRGTSAAMKLSSPLVMPIDSPMMKMQELSDISAEMRGGSFFVRARARILYTIAPHDKSIWESIRNPVYVLCMCLGLFPRVNILWWILVYTLHDLNDEWQLSQFIAGFQTSRFVSQGVFGTLRGSVLYYLCANRDSATCNVSGPGVRTFLDGPAFVLQVQLVNHCYRRLPHPMKRIRKPEELSRSRVLKAAFPNLTGGTADNLRTSSKKKRALRLHHGGHLTKLFYWHSCIVI